MTAMRLVTGDVTWPESTAIAADRVISGSPRASTLVLHESGACQLGLWNVTEGEFTTDHAGYVEYIHILGGRGRLVDLDGNVTHLSAGVTVLMDEGWNGRWVVEETISKSYMTVNQ